MNHFFKNARIFNLNPDVAKQIFSAIRNDQLQGIMEKMQFQVGSHDFTNVGWFPVQPNTDPDRLYWSRAYALDVMLNAVIAKKVLPSSAVNARVAEVAKKTEEAQGFKPGRKQRREIKEAVIEEMLPKAFVTYRHVGVWLDLARHRIVIDAGSASVADTVLGLLFKTFPEVVCPVRLEESPAKMMTQWVLGGEVHEHDDLGEGDTATDFTIDDRVAFLGSDSTKAAYKGCITDDIFQKAATRHVQHGRQVVKLAMTYADRVSFVLDDGFNIKSIKPLDVLREDAVTHDDYNQFDADMAIMLPTLAQLIYRLITLHGGEL